MNSTLIVTTPAESQDLTTIAIVRAVAGITEAQVSNASMAILIQQASGICAEYCGRSFGLETLTETFRPRWSDAGQGQLILSRRPVVSITSAEEDGAVVDAADYEVDPASGLLQRLSSDAPTAWGASKIVVVYVAGYLLLDGLPSGIERACIELVKNYWSTGSRDASLRSERVDIPGVRTIDRSYWVGASSDPAIPKEVTDLLDPHREIFV